jgi:hypothetical protein
VTGKGSQSPIYPLWGGGYAYAFSLDVRGKVLVRTALVEAMWAHLSI